ncbi:uncharacterized protein I303_106374 [Kwoniella dejecticola CBS 10117]|uniref:Uncharacterized protein n=1 Tax=Kwoniella dejecticola CBS 10117 TaxID=1296121 RepID=A0A1A5ZUW0_9TREE|nr:uncharacterized protein I303_08369 [Kwoniella dejecticola CBS 10117]OBR81598.1 hypothetical protein I303_08369 [Kwoniella dejecticola CBS 10117]
MDELDYNEIFARFPIFRIIKTYDITLKLLPSTSNTPLHPSEFLCDLFEVPLTRDVDEYMLASETNGYFPEHWRLRHAYKKVSIQPLRIGDLDPEEDLAIFFNAWKTHRGIFRYPVKKLCFPCPAAAKHLYDIFKQMPHSIHAIPRKMEIAPIEEPGGPSLVDLIMSLCQWVEQLDMAPLEIEHHRVIMTLQDFLRININSKFASLLDGSKVKFKRLNIPLKLEPSASESYDSEDLDALMDNAYPPVNLEEFTITLDLALENGDGDPNPIPALSQIARAMYAIGGTGCRYELRMAGINNRVIRSWVLNNSFQMEMKEVQKNWKPPTIGWRKLAPKEKVRVG